MKRKIRLTESDLHRIVKESVNRVLKEGKFSNNKPYFDKYYSGAGGKQGRKIKPGEQAYNGLDDNGNYDVSDWDLNGNHIQNGGLNNRESADLLLKACAEDNDAYFKQYFDDQANRGKLQQAMQKHNQRRGSYMYNGNHGENSDRLYTLWGSKEQEDEAHQIQMERRRKFADMLKVNGISLKQYNSLSDEEKDECWGYYNDWNSPRNRRARYWDEIGDPNWDLIYDNM